MSHDQPTVIVDSGASYRESPEEIIRKQAEEIEYWKDMFEKAMEYSKHLESQVYGGTTK
jgi:hypothetical protein